MGKIEENSRKRRKRGEIQKLILSGVAIAGGLAVAAVAPNVLGTMLKLNLIPIKRENEIIKYARQRLVKRGLLEYRDKKLFLTPQGERVLRLFEIEQEGLKQPKKWDERWRVLIFDIPESRRKIRARVREILVRLGFIRLQDSVWVYPYDCEEVITLIKADLKVGKDILYLIVDSLELDGHLRKHFRLRL